MTEKEWLKAEVEKIKNGAPLRQRCIMATEDRVQAGVCQGDIPADRVAHRQDTCSPGCQEAKRRLRREYQSTKQCRFCGRGFTKKQRADYAARQNKTKRVV